MIVLATSHCIVPLAAARYRSQYCKSCGNDYAYEQRIEVEGIASTPTQAAKKAQAMLQKRWSSQNHSPAACPHCGAFPQAMRAAASREYAFALRKTYVSRVFAGSFAACLLFISLLALRYPGIETAAWWVIILTVLVLSVLSMLVLGIALSGLSWIFCRIAFFHQWDMNSAQRCNERLASPAETVFTREDMEALLRKMSDRERERRALLIDW